MLDLNRFSRLAARFPIRDRDTGSVHYLRFNASQQKIMRQCHEHLAKGLPLWIIFLKARRLGVSTWATALLIAHCISRSLAAAMTVAQLRETADEMFQLALGFTGALPFHLPPPTTKQITFPHRDGKSTLRKATAKTVIGGRGLTLSALHMTEAAFYPGEDSFVALLSTVSKNDPENIVIIETTANGMEGPGEAYYNYWEGAVRGANGFLPIFLPWYEDPGCHMDPSLARDAPADDYERWLMKEFKCTKGQIAWFRWCLEAKCGGSIYKWRQEYPSTPEEAFVSSGNPAFDNEEIALAKRFEGKPICRGNIRLVDNTPIFDEQNDGPLWIYEFPEIGNHYFIGVDSAKGTESGDFAAAIGWNGCSGRMAFRYDARIGPEVWGDIVYALGIYYQKAMLNVELTGGWGYIVLKQLRDKWHYTNFYQWRSRDDRYDVKPRTTVFWETTDRSRRMLLDSYRTSLRRKECFPTDTAFIQQMARAVIELGWRWTVLRGHDDIFMAGILGWIAVYHYHHPHSKSDAARKSNLIDAQEGNENNLGLTWLKDPTSIASGMLSMNSEEHFRKVMNYRKGDNDANIILADRLAGI
jgi:hypothetical protein